MSQLCWLLRMALLEQTAHGKEQGTGETEKKEEGEKAQEENEHGPTNSASPSDAGDQFDPVTRWPTVPKKKGAGRCRMGNLAWK